MFRWHHSLVVLLRTKFLEKLGLRHSLVCVDAGASVAPLVFLPHIALSDPLVRVTSHPASDKGLVSLPLAAVAAPGLAAADRAVLPACHDAVSGWKKMLEWWEEVLDLENCLFQR
jgi:hypothetical protein